MGKRVNELHFQADMIESVLASHRIMGRVTGGSVTPQLVRFHLAPALGTKVSQITRLSEELALALGTSSCRIVRRGQVVDLEFPRREQSAVNLFDLVDKLDHVPPYTTVLGLDGNGAPILLRLASPDVPHVLISGTTGSGKTALARAMITSLALFNSPSELGLLLIDPKGRGYAPFATLPHLLAPIAQKPEDAVSALEWLVTEMERRDRERITLPRIVTFIDELADLALVAGPTLTAALTRVSQRGREAGLHLVCCTQKPSSAIVGSLVKANFPARLVGAVASAEDAKVASGIPRSGAERLVGRGDFLLVVHATTHRLQAAYATEHELTRNLPEGAAPLPLSRLTAPPVVMTTRKKARAASGAASATTQIPLPLPEAPEPLRPTGTETGSAARRPPARPAETKSAPRERQWHGQTLRILRTEK